VLIGFLANLLGLGGLPAKIKGVMKAVQRPINKAIQWIILQAAKFAKKAAGMLGGRKKKDQQHETNDPEHDVKVAAGLADLDEQEARRATDGKITQEEAEQVAAGVKKRHPVFKSISVVDAGDRWKYRYIASEGEYEGLKKKGIFVVSVLDEEPPAKSAIGQMPPARFKKTKDAWLAFEIDVGKDLVELLPNIPEKDKKLTTYDPEETDPEKRGRWGSKKSRMPGGFTLPKKGGRLQERLLQDPKLNITGMFEDKSTYTRPDFLGLSLGGVPQVEVFEVTLDADFSINYGAVGEESHKEVQLQKAIRGISAKYPNVPIIYNIRASERPSKEAIEKITEKLEHERRLNSNLDVQVIWRYG
jgi:hypothetical protein